MLLRVLVDGSCWETFMFCLKLRTYVLDIVTWPLITVIAQKNNNNNKWKSKRIVHHYNNDIHTSINWSVLEHLQTIGSIVVWWNILPTWIDFVTASNWLQGGGGVWLWCDHKTRQETAYYTVCNCVRVENYWWLLILK